MYKSHDPHCCANTAKQYLVRGNDFVWRTGTILAQEMEPAEVAVAVAHPLLTGHGKLDSATVVLLQLQREEEMHNMHRVVCDEGADNREQPSSTHPQARVKDLC